MNEEAVRQVVTTALERVTCEDPDLLRFDVNERSITHRLAFYLEEEIGEGWDVDVEYNRVGEAEVRKRISIDHLESKIPADADSEDPDAKTVYPDIIVHKRGQKFENLLVIEAKKSGRSGEYDREKLAAYVEKLDYEFGLFVRFTVTEPDEEPGYRCEWYPFDE